MKRPVYIKVICLLWALWSLFVLAVQGLYTWTYTGFWREREQVLLNQAGQFRNPTYVADWVIDARREVEKCRDPARWKEYGASLPRDNPAAWCDQRAEMFETYGRQFGNPEWCEQQARSREASALQCRHNRRWIMLALNLACATGLIGVPGLVCWSIIAGVRRIRERKRRPEPPPA